MPKKATWNPNENFSYTKKRRIIEFLKRYEKTCKEINESNLYIPTSMKLKELNEIRLAIQYLESIWKPPKRDYSKVVPPIPRSRRPPT